MYGHPARNRVHWHVHKSSLPEEENTSRALHKTARKFFSIDETSLFQTHGDIIQRTYLRNGTGKLRKLQSGAKVAKRLYSLSITCVRNLIEHWK